MHWHPARGWGKKGGKEGAAEEQQVLVLWEGKAEWGRGKEARLAQGQPHLTMEAVGRYFADDQPWPKPYLPARPKRKVEPASFLEQLGKEAPRIRHARRHGL